MISYNNIMKITKEQLKNNILDIFYPRHIKCIICGKEISNEKYDMCASCRANLPMIKDHICDRCGQEILEHNKFCDNCKRHSPWYFEKAFAPVKYIDKMISIVHRLKYHNCKYLSDPMADLMTDYIKDQDIKFDVVVPVPMLITKQKIRGYNQAELLAKSVADKLACPLDTTTLVRIRESVSQTTLSAKNRWENMVGAFATNGNTFEGQNVLLVDDVYTTGATVNECSKILKSKAKADKVYILTFAHSQGLEDDKKKSKIKRKK